MAEIKKDNKMTIRLSSLAAFRLDRSYKLDGSRSKNEFIEKAITRYLDQLEMEQNETLPAALTTALNGRLDLLEKRISSLGFHLAVTTDTLSGVIADVCKIPREELRKLHSDSVQNVKRTNGRIDLEDQLKEERNAEKAVDYFTQAAEGGNQFAQYMLGKLCLMGQGIQQSKEQALYWFTHKTFPK